MHSASGSRYVRNRVLQGVAYGRLHIVRCSMAIWGDRGGVGESATGCASLLALCLLLGGLCGVVVLRGAGPTFEGEVWACGDCNSVGLCHVTISMGR